MEYGTDLDATAIAKELYEEARKKIVEKIGIEEVRAKIKAKGFTQNDWFESIVLRKLIYMVG